MLLLIVSGHAVDPETDELGDQQPGVHLPELAGQVLVTRLAGGCSVQ